MGLSVWTADAEHFTVDDDLYHTADGWHQHQGGGGNSHNKNKPNKGRLKHEDKMLLKMIDGFLGNVI